MTRCYSPRFEVDVSYDLVYCCARRCDDGERRRHSLKGGYAVVGQCEIGVLVDVVGAHDGSM